jgi:hypothetical protein
MTNPAPEHVRVHQSDSGSLSDRADPAVGGAPVEATSVVAYQDRSFLSFADDEIDGPGGARYQWDERRFVALPDDSQYSVASLEGHVLDVGFAGFADPKSVPAEQHRQSGVGVVEALGGEEEPAELAPVQSAPLRWMDLRAANVLGWVGRDPPVYVGEAVEATGGGQAAVDSRSCQTALFHRGSVQLKMGACGLEHRQVVIGGPLEEVAKIVAVGVEGPAAVAGQKR